MTFTIPTYISLEASGEAEARLSLAEVLDDARVRFGPTNGAPGVPNLKISYTIGHAVLDKWSPSDERPIGLPRDVRDLDDDGQN